MQRMAEPRYDVKKAKDGSFFWTLVGGNGETLATSETYTRASDAERGARDALKAMRDEGVEGDYVDLRETLRKVVEALDDAIKHNVNATEHDSAGWTQEDYDAWEAARTLGIGALQVDEQEPEHVAEDPEPPNPQAMH